MKYEAGRGHYAVAGLQDDQGRNQHLLTLDPHYSTMYVVNVQGLRLPILPKRDTTSWANLEVVDTWRFDDRQSLRKIPLRIQRAVMHALCGALSDRQAYQVEYEKVAMSNKEHTAYINKLETRVFELEARLKEASVKVPSVSESVKKPSGRVAKSSSTPWPQALEEILGAPTRRPVNRHQHEE